MTVRILFTNSSVIRLMSTTGDFKFLLLCLQVKIIFLKCWFLFTVYNVKQ